MCFFIQLLDVGLGTRKDTVHVTVVVIIVVGNCKEQTDAVFGETLQQARGRYSMLRNRMKAFAKGEHSCDLDTSALCVLFNDSPYHHMSACGLGDGPQGACNGQTDNPNGDFNVTIQNMPSNAPSKSKVTKCKLSSTAMSLPSHSPDASGGCIWVFVLSR